MPEQHNLKQWIHDLFTSIDNKNTDEFSRFLTEDVQFRFGNLPVTQGKSAVTEQVDYFFNSLKTLKHTINDFWLMDDAISCHGTVTYTRHDNSKLTIPFCNIFKINMQGIFEYLIFADVSNLYQTEN
ncbi:MAG TPA: nuclear transport factor 2 family protein [Gammaproteobacteria bacterium]